MSGQEAHSGIIFLGQFLNSGGYSVLCQNFAKAVHRLGIPLRTINWGHVIPQVQKDFGEFVDSLSTADVGDSPVLVVCDIPDRYRLIDHKGIPRVVGMTIFETDRIPGTWVTKCNAMDNIIVPSDFNLNTFANSGVNPFLLKKVPVGIDMDFFSPASPHRITKDIGEAKGKFVFLYRFGLHYRKGFDILLEAFLREFAGERDAALYLSCFPVKSGVKRDAENTPFDLRQFLFDSISNKSNLPKESDMPLVVVKEEWLSDAEFLGLYDACDMYFSTERASGWSIPCMEMMAMGKPVAAIDWGGGTEFMNDDNAFLIRPTGKMVPVDSRLGSENHWYTGHMWPEVTIDEVRRVMRMAFKNAALREKKAKAGMELVRSRYGLEIIGEKLAGMLNVGIPSKRVISEKKSSKDLFQLVLRGHPRPVMPGEEFLPLLRQMRRDGKTRVTVYGAGENCKNMLQHAKVEDIEYVCIIDDDPDKQGKKLKGILVTAPEEMKTFSPDALVISSRPYAEEMYRKAKKLAGEGLRILSPYLWKRDSSSEVIKLKTSTAPAKQDGFGDAVKRKINNQLGRLRPDGFWGQWVRRIKTLLKRVADRPPNASAGNSREEKSPSSFEDLLAILKEKNAGKVALFGTIGWTPRLVKELPGHNIEVSAVIETAPQNKTGKCGGYDVLPLETLAAVPVDAVLVTELGLRGQRVAFEVLEMCFEDIPVISVPPTEGLPPIKNSDSLFNRSIFKRPLKDTPPAEKCRVVMAPVFTHHERLFEEYFKLQWYLPEQEGVEVIIPVEENLLRDYPDAADFTKPDYFGQWGTAHRHIKLRAVSAGSLPGDLEKAWAVMVWDTGGLTAQYFKALDKIPNILLIDKNHKAMRSGFSCAYMDYFVQSKQAIYDIKKKSKQNLQKLSSDTAAIEDVYIFGTGPSLQGAGELDFSKGIRIVCNTIVKNDELLGHIKPHVIVAADADFHFGCSRYAAQFRADLVAALEKTGAMFACPEVHVPLMLHHYPHLAERTIGIPVVNSHLNIQLQERFWLSAKDNVLVQFLIPLAATVGERIFLIGFDGKKPGDEKFWSHDPASQYALLLKTVEDCHPAFFDYRNYDHYFERHCKLIEDIITLGESIGKEFISLTNSVIPALAARSA